MDRNYGVRTAVYPDSVIKAVAAAILGLQVRSRLAAVLQTA